MRLLCAGVHVLPPLGRRQQGRQVFLNLWTLVCSITRCRDDIRYCSVLTGTRM